MRMEAPGQAGAPRAQLPIGAARTWEALGVAQDGDGDEQGGSSGSQEADPPRPHPQRVLGGDVDPAGGETQETQGKERR